MPIAQSSSRNQTGSTKSSKQHKTSMSESVEETRQQVIEQPTNTGTKTPPEQPEFIKQTLIIIEKKVRNLDKRRIKLEEYKENARKGATLNEDQLSAVAKYDEVLRTLELTKEMEKSFIGLANDAMKQQKKQMKKEQMEREEQLKEKLKETHRYYSLLENFGDETIRSHFMTESLLTEAELTFLDEFSKLVEPCTPGSRLESASAEFADHFTCVVEGKNKPVQGLSSHITYSELKKLFERLLAASYWTSEPKQVVAEPVAEQVPETVDESANTTEQTLNQAVESLQLEQQQQQAVQQNEQGSYQNVDDYVIVTQSECAESLCHSKSPSLQPGQQVTEQQMYDQMQSKTFFSTLNQPAEQRQNINEFISNCETNGTVNFFQDSELSRQQQEQQQQQNEMNFQQQNNQFNQQSDNKDQGFRQRGGNQNNRGGPYKGPRNDRQNGERGPQGPRGPRQNNGYRGGANQGPRTDRPSGERGPQGNRGPRPNNGHRGNYPQQPRGNFSQQDMGHQQSQMA